MNGYFWDSNILRAFSDNPDHPVLRQHLDRISWESIFLPSVVVAETWRGWLRRIDTVPKKKPDQAIVLHSKLAEAHEMLRRFSVIPFNRNAANRLSVLQQKAKRQKKSIKKRHADMMIAAMTSSNHFIVVTRNEKDFIDWLLPGQVENWIDNPPA